MRTYAPGPVEKGLLEQLAPTVESRVHWLPSGGALRALEGGQGPAVVLLHGRGHAAPLWFTYLAALARGRRVLALDLPGFGHSSAPEGPLRTGEDGLRFFVEPVEELLQTLAPGPLALVGHSLGGLVALELALRGRVPVERLVLVDSMGLGPKLGGASRCFFHAGPERVARNLGPWAFARISPMPDTPLGQRLGALEYELMDVPGGRPEAARAFNALAPLLGDAFHRAGRLAEVTAPTLLLWGERDETVPVSLAEAAAKAMPAARLVRWPVGHSPHLDRPDLFLPALRAFLDEPSPGSGTAPG
ncbi:alpha/beta fold hydrolase [Myxococcaceae bacterium GXIMD 01537]